MCSGYRKHISRITTYLRKNERIIRTPIFWIVRNRAKSLYKCLLACPDLSECFSGIIGCSYACNFTGRKSYFKQLLLGITLNVFYIATYITSVYYSHNCGFTVEYRESYIRIRREIWFAVNVDSNIRQGFNTIALCKKSSKRYPSQFTFLRRSCIGRYILNYCCPIK